MKTHAALMAAALAALPLLFAVPAHAGGYVPLPPHQAVPRRDGSLRPAPRPAGKAPVDASVNDTVGTVPDADLPNAVAGQDLRGAA